eukprot:5983303-Prymnesium_polylepis.3
MALLLASDPSPRIARDRRHGQSGITLAHCNPTLQCGAQRLHRALAAHTAGGAELDARRRRSPEV